MPGASELKPLNIFLVDDHIIFLEGLLSLLENDKYKIAGTATNAENALKLIPQTPVDLLITDLNLPGMDGLKLTEHIKKQFPSLRVIMLSMHDEIQMVRDALKAGVNGYIMKRDSHQELVLAIETVSRNEMYISKELNSKLLAGLANTQEQPLLTDREKEVLKMIAEDLSNQEIADRLHISKRTVETHRKNLMLKTGSNSVVGLVNFAYKNRLLDN
ncbi:MAG: response regulator transcription factor [Calditrichae bacterium]|nr:response regulator transcription factor [Calditrichota bacterium]MCB9057974.1 response regulator transcription factor [Calditrichia bacterium]